MLRHYSTRDFEPCPMRLTSLFGFITMVSDQAVKVCTRGVLGFLAGRQIYRCHLLRHNDCFLLY